MYNDYFVLLIILGDFPCTYWIACFVNSFDMEYEKLPITNFKKDCKRNKFWLMINSTFSYRIKSNL